MEVILREHVEHLGNRGDVVKVAEGYARNFLLPRKLATEASKGALSALDEQKKAHDKREAESLAETRAMAELLESKPVVVRAKAGGSGRLFGAVTTADVARAFAQTFSVPVDKHKIEMKTAIKSVGTYPVEIRLGRSVVAKATVDVVAEPA